MTKNYVSMLDLEEFQKTSQKLRASEFEHLKHLALLGKIVSERMYILLRKSKQILEPVTYLHTRSEDSKAVFKLVGEEYTAERFIVLPIYQYRTEWYLITRDELLEEMSK
jgi:hypothetical protein